MTQKERQERSKKEILQAAVEEFGEKDYAKVTMDSICARRNISKGMMYHYFSGKDELFLICVKNMFFLLKDFISNKVQSLMQNEEISAIKEYFLIREEFFSENPLYKNIFENAMFKTPKHLTEQVVQLRKPRRDLNQCFIESLLSKMEIRDSLSFENASRYISSIEYVFWGLVRQYKPCDEMKDFHSLVEASEEIFDMIFYGIVKQKNRSISE